MNRLKPFIFSLALALLAGCAGLADVAYNNAPSLVASEIDDAFDLDGVQSEQLDSRLEQFFLWHRQQELARYEDFLDRAAMAAADGITAAEFLLLRNEVNDARQRALDKAIDSLGDLAITLSPEQIASFEAYHRERSEEYLDYLEKSEQQREIYRVERSYDRLENWFGDFDYYLEKRVRARLRQLPDIYLPWYEYREQRHQALLKALRDLPANGFDQQKLRSVMLDPTTSYARAFDSARRSYWQAYGAALEDISTWLNDQQRQRVVSKLQRYARLVERLREQS